MAHKKPTQKSSQGLTQNGHPIQIKTKKEAGSALNEYDLSLRITDSTILTYIARFSDPKTRDEQILNALKVGVIALQSASPTIDTSIVDHTFGNIQAQFNKQMQQFDATLSQTLQKFLHPKTGLVDGQISNTFGKKGTIPSLFQEYFGKDSGVCFQLIQNAVSDQSAFGKIFDPDQTTSLFFQLEDQTTRIIQEKLQFLDEAFDMNDADSMIMQLKNSLQEEMTKLKESNIKFQSQLETFLKMQSKNSVTKEKSTQKGVEFEYLLFPPFAQLAAQLGDFAENTGNRTGKGHGKTGDFVLTLGPESGAPYSKIVIEVKDDKSYAKDFNRCKRDMEAMKVNREAAFGIFVFPSTNAPPQVGHFTCIGHDFYVTVDKDGLPSHSAMIYLETALKITRSLAILNKGHSTEDQFDEEILRILHKVQTEVEKFADLQTQIKKIHKKTQDIAEGLTEDEDTLLTGIATLLETLA